MNEPEFAPRFDVFISHASEDKAEVVMPLAKLLEQRGLSVWLDAHELQLGDSLRRSIDRGLGASAFGVVVLSRAFLRKEWPSRELDALVAFEDAGPKKILPVWHQIEHRDVVQYSPLLAGRLAVSTARGLELVAAEIERAVRGSASPSPEHRPSIDYAAIEIAAMRQSLLVQTLPADLRRHLYSVDEFLGRYPRHPDGRALRDQILGAIAYASPPVRATESAPASLPASPYKRSGSRPKVLAIVGLLVLGALMVGWFALVH